MGYRRPECTLVSKQSVTSSAFWFYMSRLYISALASKGRNGLTDCAMDRHRVRLIDGLAAVEEQFDLLPRLQGQR